MNRVKVAFYGDDFTGSTDALQQFHRFGLRGTLFLSSPTDPAFDAAAETYDVIGVAGLARSLPRGAIEAEIRPIFERFAKLECELIQYKICSTFDSSPDVGSLGPAIAVARDTFGATALPVMPAQPEFGRHTVFANHFARTGHETFRIDRHPTMSRHPTTPIDEADLRRFLERQIDGRVALFDLVSLRSGDDEALLAHIARLRAAQPAAIVFDALENDDLIRVARLLRNDASRKPIVALGSGGLSYGFGAALTAEMPQHPAHVRLPAVEKILVVSGSRSFETADQIAWALEHGWRGLRVDPMEWLVESERGRDDSVRAVAMRVVEALSDSRRGVVVFSALGPEDRAPQDGLRSSASSRGTTQASALGDGLGRIARHVLETTDVRRAIIAGGDTSGYAARALGAESLKIIAPLVPAGALCRLQSASVPNVDGAEVMFKGGQVGSRELFEIVRTADASAASDA